jgi:hypothetical protein
VAVFLAVVIRAMKNIALMTEAANTFETSVNFYQTTRRNNQQTAAFILAAVRT